MTNESIRIRTTVGANKNIRFKLEHDFNFLEILSLKISQEDLYQAFCSNYGVVVGRVIVNKGFGLPNAKVSVFVPITSEDQKNDLIKDLYPFKTPFQKNGDGIRYNLLLSKATCILNKPVGTFPSKEDVLDNDIVLEVFDKYYKYTTKTNDAGDYMIFGVPVGDYTIHMDVDLSDAGIVSIRPYDLIDDGYPEKLFQSRVEFKTSTNLDTLPQIKSANIGASVIPFWGDPESCEIGITRVDVDTNYEIKTNAILFGSIFTDAGKMNLNKGCVPRMNMGDQDHLRTGEGNIGMIRVSEIDPIEWYNSSKIKPVALEEFSIDGGDLINQDGVFAFTVPMNLAHVITDEFGVIVPSPDASIGVATKGMYRFKMKFTEPASNPKFRTATLLFPSLGTDFGGTEGVVDTGSLAQANGTQDQRFTADICNYNTSSDPIPACGPNYYDNSRIFLDFHTFEWKQLYTIAHFIKKYKRGPNRFNFIGVKNTDVSGETNLFPFTNAVWKFDILYYMMAFIIDFIAFMLKMLIIIVSVCLQFCIRLRISWGASVLKVSIGFDITIIDFCYQICPFAWLGGLIPAFTLPCEGAPNDGYRIPPTGYATLASCNPSSCGGSTFGCNCVGSNPCSGCDACVKFDTTGTDTSDNACLAQLENWKCCVKYNLAESRNVIRRNFNDAWVFGTAYLFQFKYKKKKSGKEKFCGPGSDHLRGDNYLKQDCCIDTQSSDCKKCLVRGPHTTQNHSAFGSYHYNNHNWATDGSINGTGEGFTGAVDVDDIVYCNSLMSTKIVSLGRIEMCEETLEGIESATLAGQALHQYAQDPSFYTGTFNENGWDAGYWVDYLKESSYEDPRDVFLYLLHHTSPPCSPRDMFHGGGIEGYPCHEYELKSFETFFIKEVSKIYTDIELCELQGTQIVNGLPVDLEDQFGNAPGFGGESNPYGDLINPPAAATYGGFIVNKLTGSRFSPCGGNPSNCLGQPNNQWTHAISPISWSNVSGSNTDEADNDGFDRYNDQGDRNNPNTKSNIPYYYFGIHNGKTAINKLRKDYFVQK